MAKRVISIGRMTRFVNGVMVGGNPAKESSLDWLEREWRSAMNPHGINEAVSVARDGWELTVITTDGDELRFCWQP